MLNYFFYFYYTKTLPMSEIQKTRVDKWLWSIRIFKTRTLATDACNAGKVKIQSQTVKPSQLIKINDEIHLTIQGEKKIYKVLKIIEKRVGASIAAECYEDLSPPSIHDKKQDSFFYNFEVRDKGVGRPTKKERRAIEQFKDPD
jgi:ribosome-associated heat shock protein Hsp15